MSSLILDNDDPGRMGILQMEKLFAIALVEFLLLILLIPFLFSSFSTLNVSSIFFLFRFLELVLFFERSPSSLLDLLVPIVLFFVPLSTKSSDDRGRWFDTFPFLFTFPFALFTYDQRSILLLLISRDNDNSLPFVLVAVVFALSTILLVPFLLFSVLLLIVPLRVCIDFLFSLSLLMILEEFFRFFVVPATAAIFFFFFLFFPSISVSNLATLAFCGGRDDLDNLFLLLLLYLLEDNDDDDFDDDEDDDDSKGRLRGFLFSILIASITKSVLVFASTCTLSVIFHSTVLVLVTVHVWRWGMGYESCVAVCKYVISPVIFSDLCFQVN